MDFGLVTVMTRLRAGRSWKRGSISEWGSRRFSLLPLWGPPSPLFDDYLGLLRSTTKIRRALSYSRIRAVIHIHRDIFILCGRD
jgi:hypothetical protein